MERTQADAIAQALLAPDLNHLEATQHKRAVETAYLSRKRKGAWHALAGTTIGGGAAYFSGAVFSAAVIWGSLPPPLQGGISLAGLRANR